MMGAGTDANVFMVMFGENGDSGELALKSSETYKDKFERNHTDVFNFKNLLSLGKRKLFFICRIQVYEIVPLHCCGYVTTCYG